MRTVILIYGLSILMYIKKSNATPELFDLHAAGNNTEVVLIRYGKETGRESRSFRDTGSFHFRAFRRSFHVTLRPADWSGLVSSNFALIFRNQSGMATIASDLSIDVNCFHQGHVSVEQDTSIETVQGTAAINVCNGLRGVVLNEDGRDFYVLEPLQSSTDAHLVRRVSVSEDLTNADKSQKRTRDPFFRKKRKKRNLEEEITIETAIFVDEPLFLHMRTSFPTDTELHLTHFVLAMMNAVQLLYQDESLGVSVRFQVHRLEIWTRQPDELHLQHKTRNDIDRYLNRFCRWQNAINPRQDTDPLHWDHALLLTGLDLYSVGRDGQASDQIVGLAPVGGMCSAKSSCTINEGRHFESVYVVAHEIGHNLGMRHDGLMNGNDCDSGSFIMSPTLGSGKVTWSPCSRRYLQRFLSTDQSYCLRDRSFVSRWLQHNATGLLPGQRFTADEQCMLRHGPESVHWQQQPVHEVCRDLLCVKISNRFQRQTETPLAHPALEGTTCADGHWCRKGQCVPNLDLNNLDSSRDSGKNLENLRWESPASCVSPCLYTEDGSLHNGSTGIVTLYNKCRSFNQREDCAGFRVGYQTCSPEQICRESEKITIQQYADAICRRAAVLDNLLLPQAALTYSNNDPRRSCQIWCLQRSGGFYSNSWNLPDGTLCGTTRLGNEANQLVCVSGVCQEFSCEEGTAYRLDPEVCGKLLRLDKTNKNDIEDSKHHKLGKFQQQWQLMSGYRDNYFESIKPSQIMENGIAVYEAGPRTTDFLHSQTSRTSVGKWGPWVPASSCRTSCLTGSRGLRLVVRSCGETSCRGKNSSIQICTAQNEDCTTHSSIVDFSNKICSQLSWTNSTITNYGTQLTESTDSSCSVHCYHRDLQLPIRIDGERGWFPSGTKCHYLENRFCVSGRCLAFDQDGIPAD